MMRLSEDSNKDGKFPLKLEVLSIIDVSESCISNMNLVFQIRIMYFKYESCVSNMNLVFQIGI